MKNQTAMLMLAIWAALFSSLFVYVFLMFNMRFSDFSIEEILFYDQGKLPFIILSILAGFSTFIIRTWIEMKTRQNNELKKLLPFYVAIWALCESIAIFGFAVGLTRNSNSSLPFFALSILLMVIHFPVATLFHRD